MAKKSDSKPQTVYRYKVTKIIGKPGMQGVKVGSILIENKSMGKDGYTYTMMNRSTGKITGHVVTQFIGTGKVVDGKLL